MVTSVTGVQIIINPTFRIATSSSSSSCRAASTDISDPLSPLLLYTYRCSNKRRVKTSLTKYLPLTLFVRVRKGLLKVCVWEGAGDRTETSFSFSWCSTGGPEAHSAGWWLSLLHLINNFSGPQLNRGPRAPSAWCGFPYHILSITPPDL